MAFVVVNWYVLLPVAAAMPEPHAAVIFTVKWYVPAGMSPVTAMAACFGSQAISHGTVR